MLNSSSEAVVVTEQGLAIKTRAANVRRIPESAGWDADRILGLRAVPCPDGSDNAFDIQVGMERPAEMVLRSPGEMLMEDKAERTYLRRADFELWGLSEGCRGCRYLRTGQGRQQAHSEASRWRVESLLKGDSSGPARLAAADERITCALPPVSSRVGASEENCAGHKARLDTTRFSLPRRTISIRCTTQRHHKHRPEHQHKRRDERNENRTQDVTRASSKDPERVGMRQQKKDRNEETTA